MLVVSLGDRRLSIPTTGPLNDTTIQRFNLPVPATVTTGNTTNGQLGDLRPFAVQIYKGKVYVGAV